MSESDAMRENGVGPLDVLHEKCGVTLQSNIARLTPSGRVDHLAEEGIFARMRVVGTKKRALYTVSRRSPFPF